MYTIHVLKNVRLNEELTNFLLQIVNNKCLSILRVKSKYTMAIALNIYRTTKRLIQYISLAKYY